MPLSFHAKVELKGASRAWQSDGAVAMVKLNDGRAVVRWEPSVVHPRLDGTKVLAVQPNSASASQVVDRKGRPLTEFPSVQAVLDQIRFKNEGTTASGGTGVVVTQAGVQHCRAAVHHHRAEGRRKEAAHSGRGPPTGRGGGGEGAVQSRLGRGDRAEHRADPGAGQQPRAGGEPGVGRRHRAPAPR